VVLPTEGTADDVHALESIGVVATTAPMGARNFHKVSRLTFRLGFRMSQAMGAAICEYDDARIGDDPPADSDAPAGLTCRAPQGTVIRSGLGPAKGPARGCCSICSLR
jgi:hypothetical protein